MKVSVHSDLSQVNNYIGSIGSRHLPFATAKALTATAVYSRRQLVNEMRRKFDRPKPQTVNELNGPLYVKSADYRKLRAGQYDYAEVRVKDQTAGGKGDPAIAWLSHNIHGGPRIEKRSENLLRRAGILPNGYYAVPGEGAKLNQYGNMSNGQIQQILSKMNAQWDKWANSHKQSRSKLVQDYFLVNKNNPRTAHFPVEGVWQRYGRNRYEVKPVLVFVRRIPRYKPIIKFFDICNQTAQFRFPREFYIAMKGALATAGRSRISGSS